VLVAILKRRLLSTLRERWDLVDYDLLAIAVSNTQQQKGRKEKKPTTKQMKVARSLTVMLRLSPDTFPHMKQIFRHLFSGASFSNTPRVNGDEA